MTIVARSKAMSSDSSDSGGENNARINEGPADSPQAIVTQPSDKPVLRDWNDDLCECYKDPLNCLLVGFCPLCAGCVEFSRHGENPILGCFSSLTLMALAARYRERNRIKGSLCTDCLMAVYCYQCLMCRLHRDATT